MSKPDLSAFDAVLAARRSGQPLRVDGVLAELPADKAEALAAALRDTRYNPVAIAEVVANQWGVPVSSAAIRTWRRRNGVE